MINVIIEDMIDVGNGALILPLQIASSKWNTTTLSILDLVRVDISRLMGAQRSFMRRTTTDREIFKYYHQNCTV